LEHLQFIEQSHERLRNLGKELRMSIEIDNAFPLMPIALPKVNTLQKESTSDLPSKNPQNSVILNNILEPEPNNLWEKGTFVDLYI